MTSPSGPASDPAAAPLPPRTNLGMPQAGVPVNSAPSSGAPSNMVRPGSILPGRAVRIGAGSGAPESGTAGDETVRTLGRIPGRVGDGYDEDQSAFEGTFYHQVGGRETFRRLAEKFYEGVAADPGFRAMYPEEDLYPAQMRLQMFLEQYWGGPGTYSQRRGHPRLRMRHMPYPVDSGARDTWLRHMRAAVEALDLPPLQAETLWDYFDRAAHSLQNRPD
jgi:hemoglobin